MRRKLFALLCAPFALAFLAWWVLLRHAGPVPRFEAAACPPGVGTRYTGGARCGFLVVPERHAHPDGPTIRLAVAIFRSWSATRAPDPVVLLEGGPGYGAISRWGGIPQEENTVYVGDRDLILLDQRGTGLSQPALDCPEDGDVFYKLLDQNPSLAQEKPLDDDKWRRCRDDLASRGVDLGAYTTLESAADVHDLQVALGYRQINLYGSSYGTLLAQEVMRRYARGLRSVILDSVVPATRNTYLAGAVGSGAAFDRLFAACRLDPTCAASYPQLAETFWQTVRALNAAPIRFSATDELTQKTSMVTFNGDNFAGLIFDVLYSPRIMPEIPKVIAQVQGGNYNELSRMFGRFGFPSGRSSGMARLVDCSADAPYATAAEIVAEASAIPEPLRANALQSSLDALARCAIWAVDPAPAFIHQPVRSAVPTLVLAGAWDPITPAAGARAVARDLTHARYVEFRLAGHGMRFQDDCSEGIVNTFLIDPVDRPDTSCIQQEPPAPLFIGPNGSASLIADNPVGG